MPDSRQDSFDDHNAPSGVTNTPDDGSLNEKSAGENAGDHGIPDSSPRDMNKFSWAFMLLAIFMTNFLYGLDNTVAADVQGPIVQSLGQIEKLAWVGIGFPLGSIAVVLLFGQLYRIMNIKWTYMISILLFEVGSALCGAAPSMNVLIVGRILAGIGGAGMDLGGLTYINEYATPREASLHNALFGVFWGIGAVLGPVIGGGFASSSATWRWAFYINICIAGLVTPIHLLLLPNKTMSPGMPIMTKLRTLDWAGIFLNISTFTLFCTVLTFAGSTWSWQAGGTIALWILLGISTIAFGFQQVYCIFTTETDRIFPVQFCKNPILVTLYITTSASAAAVFITTYYLPLFFQFTLNDSPIEAAVRLLPFIMILVATLLISGAVLPLIHRYSPFYVLSGMLMTVGGALLLVSTTTTSAAAIYGFEVLIALGSGLILFQGYSIAAANVEQPEVSGAITFINISQIGTIAIALAMSGCIFQNLGFKYLSENLAAYHLPSAELRATLAGFQSAILEHGTPLERMLAIEAVAKIIAQIFALVVAAGGLTLLGSVVLIYMKADVKL